MSACALCLRTMFTTAAGLITTMGEALYESWLDERFDLLTQPKLLIIDEIGHIPIDRQGSTCCCSSSRAATKGPRFC